MGLIKLMDDLNSYLAEAVAQIFSPSSDSYPEIGVQPYSGELIEGKVEVQW